MLNSSICYWSKNVIQVCKDLRISFEDININSSSESSLVSSSSCIFSWTNYIISSSFRISSVGITSNSWK